MVTHPTRTEFDAILNHFLGERIAGRPKQNPYVATEVQNYKIGSRLQTPDGLVWHYGRADAVGVADTYRRRGVMTQVVAENFTTIGIAAIGDYTLVINDTASAADHPKDYWANGLASIFPNGTDDMQRKIKSSTVGNGVSVTLTFYYPLTAAVIAGKDVYCTPSPYGAIRMAAGAALVGSMVGFTFMPVTALHYVWVLTWGLCQPVYTGTTTPASGECDVCFNSADGTILNKIDGYYNQQRAGFLIPFVNEQFVMLQLDP